MCGVTHFVKFPNPGRVPYREPSDTVKATLVRPGVVGIINQLKGWLVSSAPEGVRGPKPHKSMVYSKAQGWQGTWNFFAARLKCDPRVGVMARFRMLQERTAWLAELSQEERDLLFPEGVEEMVEEEVQGHTSN